MSEQHSDHINRGFMGESEMETFFSQKLRDIPKAQSLMTSKVSFSDWYNHKKTHPLTYEHHAKVGKGQHYDCDTLTDEWFKWFLTTPKSLNPMTNKNLPSTDGSSYSDTNVFLFDQHDTLVYFTTAAPFQTPDFRRIVMTRNAALLVPVYNVMSSPQLFKLNGPADYVDDVKKDLTGFRQQTISATFDGEELYGCCVVRNKALPIPNIPLDNVFGIPEDRLLDNHSTIEIYHGGFWLLIKENHFTPGDHLLKFEAKSVNYEMDAKILITVLTAV